MLNKPLVAVVSALPLNEQNPTSLIPQAEYEGHSVDQAPPNAGFAPRTPAEEAGRPLTLEEKPEVEKTGGMAGSDQMLLHPDAPSGGSQPTSARNAECGQRADGEGQHRTKQGRSADHQGGYQRREGGKAKPSQLKAELRKNRSDRTRRRDWTKPYLAGDETTLEREADHEAIRGRGRLFRQRVYVPQQAKLARELAGNPGHPLAALRRGCILRVRGLLAHVCDLGPVVAISAGGEPSGALGDGHWQPLGQHTGGVDGGQRVCTVRGALKSFASQDRKVIAVGDQVIYRPEGSNEGVIEAVEPRRTSLTRADSKHPDRQHVVVANVEQLVIVASLRQPDLRPRLIDRYLVAADRGGLEPLICLNKADLDDDRQLAYWTKLYQGLGYRVVGVSAVTGQGLDALRGALAGRVSVLAGQSGVGKSSLLNAVQPGLNLRVGEISGDNDKGRHTTTEVTLLPLSFGLEGIDTQARGREFGAVVDTPGIRSFGLWDLMAEEVEGHFVEFVDRVAGCKFADCTHRHEIGCAIKAAVEAGEIAPERYESYTAIYESLRTGRPDPRD